MAGGPLVAAAAQTTTATTGTGALTISNAVPAGAPAGSTTFAAVFAPTAAYPVPNIFYVIADASGNYEAGYGTLTSATNLTRDFVIFSGIANATAPYVPQFTQNPTSSYIDLITGTANVYSNPGLLSQFTTQQARFPNFTGNNTAGADGGLTEDIMSGTFTATLTQTGGTVPFTCRYKVSSNGICYLQFPATSQSTTGAAVTITGIPSYLTNITTVNVLGEVTANANTVIGNYSVAAGATPTSTGTITVLPYTSLTTGFNAFTASQTNGVPATSIAYPLF